MVKKKVKPEHTVIGARVPRDLDETLRDAAKARGQNLNAFLNDVLAKLMDGSPESHKPAIKSTALDTARLIRELKQEMKALRESSQGSFFGLFEDEEVAVACKALDAEIQRLKKELTKAEKARRKAEGQEDVLDWSLANPMILMFPWLWSDDDEDE